VGGSLVERDREDLAKELLAKAGAKLILPRGRGRGSESRARRERQEVSSDRIPADSAIFDIDRSTRLDFRARILKAKTVFWKRPMGVFETPPFDEGTRAIGEALIEAGKRGATTVVGGGDSAAAVPARGQAHPRLHRRRGRTRVPRREAAPRRRRPRGRVRRLLFAANWKMHLGPDEARAYLKAFRARYNRHEDRDVWVLPAGGVARSRRPDARDRGDLLVGIPGPLTGAERRIHRRRLRPARPPGGSPPPR